MCLPKLVSTNSKLSPIPHYSISLDSCVDQSPHCPTYCYGDLKRYRLPSVQKSLNRNYKATFRDDFVELMVEHCKFHRFVRIHAVGDFYSQEYFEDWVDIAKRCPNTIFNAYTRNTSIDFNKAPDNMRLRFSKDPSTEKINPTAESFSTVLYIDDTENIDHLDKHRNGRVCQSKCSKCQFCWNTSMDIYFPIHSVSKDTMIELGVVST